MFEQERIFCPLSIALERRIPARNIAELLCDLGILLRWRMRLGAGTDRGAPRVQSLRWDGQLALGFVSLPASVQLRAMVEDWPLSRIQETVEVSASERAARFEGDDLPTAV